MSTAAARLDVAAWRADVTARPLRPYEALLSSERADLAAKASAAVRADPAAALERWRPLGLPRDALVPPVAWDELFPADRSRHYHLHALEPIGLALAANSHSPEPALVDRALSIALDWLSAHPSLDVASPFAWYDMAVGLRALRLAYLLDVVARDPSRPDDAVVQLLDGLALHMVALADDSSFAAHSNHGLYQAAGQLAAARRFPELPDMDRHREQADRRLRAMIDAQFTSEGVHTEHSPGYHRMVLRALVTIGDSGLIDDPGLAARLPAIEDALAWFVRPDGVLVTIGDTDAYPLEREPFVRASSAALRFVVTGGERGAPPSEAVKAFPLSGYVVLRERWPSGPSDFGEGAHVVQMCGFHSYAHKHADDLSFTWFERGREILVDAGRFGYLRAGEMPPELSRRGFMYSDPRRIYVESTRAHNTVEIDRVSHDRRAVPYGSALRAWGEDDGIRWARSSVTHGAVEHTRMLLLLPGQLLMVVDDLEDRAGDPHHLSQRFHVAPELDVRVDEATVRLSSDGWDDHLHVLPFEDPPFAGLVAGRPEPDLLGWVSRRAGSFHPTSSFAYERDGVAAARFATLFAWGHEAPVAIGADADAFAWTLAGRERRLRLTPDEQGSPRPRLS